MGVGNSDLNYIWLLCYFAMYLLHPCLLIRIHFNLVASEISCTNINNVFLILA